MPSQRHFLPQNIFQVITTSLLHGVVRQMYGEISSSRDTLPMTLKLTVRVKQWNEITLISRIYIQQQFRQAKWWSYTGQTTENLVRSMRSTACTGNGTVEDISLTPATSHTSRDRPRASPFPRQQSYNWHTLHNELIIRPSKIRIYITANSHEHYINTKLILSVLPQY